MALGQGFQAIGQRPFCAARSTCGCGELPDDQLSAVRLFAGGHKRKEFQHIAIRIRHTKELEWAFCLDARLFNIVRG